jgi:hypothetical protein
MNVEEIILELRPELKAAAFFVANHLVQNRSATINDVHAAAWDNHRGDSFTLDGNLDVHGESRCLFSHGFFTRRKINEFYFAAAAATDAAAAAAAAAAGAVAEPADSAVAAATVIESAGGEVEAFATDAVGDATAAETAADHTNLAAENRPENPPPPKSSQQGAKWRQ